MQATVKEKWKKINNSAVYDTVNAEFKSSVTEQKDNQKC
jgi:hypothetical protein